jgi:hypothetical protein
MLHARKSYNERVQDSANIIPEDEPVFLLRGQDVLAPALLDIYVAMSRNTAGSDDNLLLAVTEHAERMRAWQVAEKSKVADMVSSDRVETE